MTDLSESKEPFGRIRHKDVAVHLGKKREFKYANEPRYSPVQLRDQSIDCVGASSCVVDRVRTCPDGLLADMRTAYTDIFNGARVEESTDGTEQFLVEGRKSRV